MRNKTELSSRGAGEAGAGRKGKDVGEKAARDKRAKQRMRTFGKKSWNDEYNAREQPRTELSVRLGRAGGELDSTNAQSRSDSKEGGLSKTRKRRSWQGVKLPKKKRAELRRKVDGLGEKSGFIRVGIQKEEYEVIEGEGKGGGVALVLSWFGISAGINAGSGNCKGCTRTIVGGPRPKDQKPKRKKDTKNHPQKKKKKKPQTKKKTPPQPTKTNKYNRNGTSPLETSTIFGNGELRKFQKER